MPVFNAYKKVRNGKLRPEDVPYMQRGGSWDNSDVKGAAKLSWRKEDTTYNASKNPGGCDWTGQQKRSSPASTAKTKNPGKQEPPKKKGWFGW
ncbi:MAG: hypothetical protein AAGJ35_14640 [Myxococcota bacterium]